MHRAATWDANGLQEQTLLGLKGGLVLQPLEEGVPELGEVMRGSLPSHRLYGPMQVYCQRLGFSAGGPNPGGLVPELSYSCVCSLDLYFAECFELKSALVV